MAFVATLFLILSFGSFWGLIYLIGRIFKRSGETAKQTIAEAPRIVSDIGAFSRRILKWIFISLLKSFLVLVTFGLLVSLAIKFW